MSLPPTWTPPTVAKVEPAWTKVRQQLVDVHGTEANAMLELLFEKLQAQCVFPHNFMGVLDSLKTRDDLFKIGELAFLEDITGILTKRKE